KDIILSQTGSGYGQNLWHLLGNQDDPKVKPIGDDSEYIKCPPLVHDDEVELVDVEDNKADDDANRSLKIFSASQQADDDNNLMEVQHHSPNMEHPEKPIVQ
ncbi:hypothetical protein Ancab_009922, partial [Ancistrocladus abbreviatus]